MSLELIFSLSGMAGILTMLLPAVRDARKTKRLWHLGVLVGLTAQPGLFVLCGWHPIPWPSLVIALLAWFSLLCWTCYAQHGSLDHARKPTRPE